MVLGRKNFLFAGSDAGGEILAEAMTVIETAKLSGLNPEAYLADILGRIRTHDPRRLDELLPWNWKAATQPERRLRSGTDRPVTVRRGDRRVDRRVSNDAARN